MATIQTRIGPNLKIEEIICLGGSRLHSTAGNRAEEACALEHGSHNRTGDTGADLKADDEPPPKIRLS